MPSRYSVTRIFVFAPKEKIMNVISTVCWVWPPVVMVSMAPNGGNKITLLLYTLFLYKRKWIIIIYEGAPVSMSAVHFLDSFEQYLGGVQGLQPDKEIHETFLDIEPVQMHTHIWYLKGFRMLKRFCAWNSENFQKTGLILNAAKRVQFNVMLNPNRDMTTFAQVRKVLIPFMWVEEVRIYLHWCSILLSFKF